MAQSLVQALEGLKFPCDRARVLEFADEHNISPRAMDFLRRLPEQQFASMGELFAVLPSKGSLRKARQEIAPGLTPRPSPPQPAVAAAPEIPEDEWDEEPQENLSAMEEAQPAEPEPPALEGLEPGMPPMGGLDPFALATQWQQVWLKGVESYTRLFMPWLRR
jgi:hypothetical protein